MLIPIREVIIKKRFRKGAPNLDPLIRSLSKHGLLHPIIVDQNKVLISGYRRLKAAEKLEWSHIEARSLFMVSQKDRQSLEIEENNIRFDFTQEELKQALKVLNNKPWYKKFWCFLKNLFRKSQN